MVLAMSTIRGLLVSQARSGFIMSSGVYRIRINSEGSDIANSAHNEQEMEKTANSERERWTSWEVKNMAPPGHAGTKQRSWLYCKMPTSIVWRPHQECPEMPAYTVAVPRPPKPPLSSDNKFKRPVNLRTPKNSPASIPKANSTHVPSTERTIPQGQYLATLMISVMDGPPYTLTYINPFNLEGPDIPLAMEHWNPYADLPNPANNLPNHKRPLSSITGAASLKDQSRSKMPKQEERSRSGSKASPSSYPESITSKGKLFACPFSKGFKKSRQSPKEMKRCMGPGPGWEISRLKEHIKRAHVSKEYKCNRCRIGFKGDAELRKHQRSARGCHVKSDAETHLMSIDQTLWLLIKKKPPKKSPEEHWVDIYRTVYNLDTMADVPSPYYEQSVLPAIQDQAPGQNAYWLNRLEHDLEARLQSPNSEQSNAHIPEFLQIISDFKEEYGLSSQSPGVSPLEFDSSDLQPDPPEAPSSAFSTSGSPEGNFFDNLQHDNFGGTGGLGPAEPGILQAPPKSFSPTIAEFWFHGHQYYEPPGGI